MIHVSAFTRYSSLSSECLCDCLCDCMFICLSVCLSVGLCFSDYLPLFFVFVSICLICLSACVTVPVPYAPPEASILGGGAVATLRFWTGGSWGRRGIVDG